MRLELSVRELDDTRVGEWDRFVEQCPNATFFHLTGWRRVIERSFGHRSFYLYAERAGAIEGVLPLFHVKSALFGKALISLPFCVYGGPATMDDEARNALDRAARDLADRLDVGHVEYRHLEQRAMVRKGLKLGVRSELDDDCARLHRVYSVSVRNLGTPVFPRRYFEELKRVFGDACEILVLTHQGAPVSGVMSFYFRDQVLPYYGGGTEQARVVAANDVMYWEVMRRACERGYRLFDFGRSKRGTGAFDFKKNWGFPVEPLHYQFVMRRGGKPPEINPLNPKFRIFVETWKRLPLGVANALGPHIVRYLG